MFQLICLCLVPIVGSALVRNPSVVIVGAGPAGIAAATKLLENSITNITILEAENRIGGRINSVIFGDGFVDIGAEYCHGEKENIVHEMVKDLHLLEHSNVINPQTNKLYYSNGSLIERNLALDLGTTFTNYEDEINKTRGLNLKEAFLLYYNSTILKKYSHDKDKLKIATDGIRFASDVLLMDEGAFSWSTPSAGKHYNASDGDLVMTWKTGGYHTILDILMKKYPIDDKLILNKTVEKIIWNRNKVTVICSDSELEADHVIFTPSVGVLKHDKDKLFQPRLPNRKLQAIEAIGFDGIIKIILHFPQRWWKNEDKAFFFIWSQEDLHGLKKEFAMGPSKDGVSWASHVMALVKVPSNPNVLVAWLGGELVPEVEKTSEKVILGGCMYVLRKFLGRDYNVTDADEIIRSQWYTNPNFRGTYSYEKAEYFEEDVSYQRQLAEPLVSGAGDPLVLFAGEATHPVLYSTVHGAIESGRREAERIMTLGNK